MFSKKSALTKALNQWLNALPSDEKKSLSDHVPNRHGREFSVDSESEAKLVCAALDKARNAANASNHEWAAQNDVRTAMAFMQQVGTAEARDAFIQHGLPRLRSLIREAIAKPEEKDRYALFALKLLAMYRQPEDVDLFAEAVRAPIEPDNYMWTPAFYAIDAENPLTQQLIDRLRDPLPTQFARVVFLDKCNALAIEGHLSSHPFASVEGLAALEQWLASTKQDEASYAVSACAALPFVPSPDRERLLEIAGRHPSIDVQMESAWAGAKMGVASAADTLVAFATDARYSSRAVAYLRELGLEQRVPPAVTEPDFVALAEMCQWLAHPNEMGCAPDEITLADSRELYWPPTKDRRQLWVFRYRYNKTDGETDEGYGLVGSVTWAMFGSNTIHLSPEDVYGLHCAWELIQCGDPTAPPESEVAAGRAILAKHNPGFGRPTLTIA